MTEMPPLFTCQVSASNSINLHRKRNRKILPRLENVERNDQAAFHSTSFKISNTFPISKRMGINLCERCYSRWIFNRNTRVKKIEHGFWYNLHVTVWWRSWQVWLSTSDCQKWQLLEYKSETETNSHRSSVGFLQAVLIALRHRCITVADVRDPRERTGVQYTVWFSIQRPFDWSINRFRCNKTLIVSPYTK